MHFVINSSSAFGNLTTDDVEIIELLLDDHVRRQLEQRGRDWSSAEQERDESSGARLVAEAGASWSYDTTS